MEASLSSFYSNNGANHLDERAHSSDNSGDNSPSTTNFTSMSSPKRRRAIQKKVITIPIKDLEGSKFKSDCTPPSDSWAWRKYGQKPIKGSPYPRGYYRCSSSKGCPARKQVERSRLDPTMLVVTYSYDHNHPWPSNSRNHHHQNRTTTNNNNNNNNNSNKSTTVTTNTELITTKTPIITNTNPKIILNNNNNNNQSTYIQQTNNNNNINTNNNVNINMDHLHQPLIPPIDELTWLSSDNEILQSDFMFNNNNFINDLDMSKLFPLRSDEDDSLFADLGELPECPVMFRTAVTVAGDEQHHQAQCGLTPWCGSIS